MASEQERKDPEKRKELDEKAQRGEVVVPGGTGGFSLEAQEHLAEGRSRGGHSRTTAEKKGGDEEVRRQVKEQTEAKPK